MKSPRQEASLLSWFFFGPALFLSWATGIDEVAPWLPFLISIPLIGLSHGAADWVLLGPKTRKKSATAFLLYALIGSATGLIAWAFPLLTVAAFFLLTAIHFGMGDERDLRAFESEKSFRFPQRFSGVVRIALFLSVVCWVDSESVALLFGSVSRLLGDPTESFFPVASFQACSGIFFGVTLGLWLVSLFRQILASRTTAKARITKRPLLELTEGAALLLCGLTLNAIYAIGLYFLCWHAFRHLILVSKSGREESNSQSLLKRIFFLHFASWPLLVPTIPLMLGLVWWNGNLSSPIHWVASFLVVCIIFTLPHHFIVERCLVRKNSTKKTSSTLVGHVERRRPQPESIAGEGESVVPSV